MPMLTHTISWNFDVSLYGPTAQNFPVLQVAVIFGSPELRWDVSYLDTRDQLPPSPADVGYAVDLRGQLAGAEVEVATRRGRERLHRLCGRLPVRSVRV